MARIVKITAIIGLLVLCGSAWALDANDPNLVAHWKFDEGSGSTAYDSAGNNDGTIYGASWTTGQIGGALDFDGSGDWVNLGTNIFSEATFESSGATLSAWVYPTSTLANRDHVIGIEGRFTIEESATSTNYWSALIHDGDTQGVKSTSTIELNKWVYLTATWNTTTLEFYVNGVSQGSVNQGTPLIDPVSRPVTIGALYDGTLYYTIPAIIDDVHIYDRALSAEEVEELYLMEMPAHERAIMKLEDAVNEKEEMLDGIEETMGDEQDAYEALEEMLESKDYGDLKKGDVVKAKQEIHSAMQHQEQAAGALDKSIEGLYDALESLGWEPEPEIVYEISDDCAGVLSATEESEELRFSVTVDGQYIHFEDMMVANCCKDALELDMEVEDNLITIHEIEHTTIFCMCICDYEVTATLGPFEPGTYTIEVYEDFGGFIGGTTVIIE